MNLLAEFVRGIRTSSEPVYWVMILHLIAIPLAAIGLFTDSRIILGINPWIKPLKFLFSTSIFLATAGWLLKDVGRSRAASMIGLVIAVSMVVENSLISMQALRGTTSHFNVSTVFNGAVFYTMALFIVLNTAAMGWLFVLYCQSDHGLAPGYLWGIRLGILLFIAGSLEAGFMLAIRRHTVGAADGGPGLPFLNWSTRFGDLRAAHFVGLHALQVLPITGWLIDRFGISPAPVAVLIAAVLYCGVFTLVLLQALGGKPLWF